MISNEIAIVDESSIRDMVYEIRGQLVMLDFGLARFYGYETKYLNRQVERNVERFPDGFRFQLSSHEARALTRCQNGTLSNSSILIGNTEGIRYLPYAFTEQGICMLMTVLKGGLAARRLFPEGVPLNPASEEVRRVQGRGSRFRAEALGLGPIRFCGQGFLPQNRFLRQEEAWAIDVDEKAEAAGG